LPVRSNPPESSAGGWIASPSARNDERGRRTDINTSGFSRKGTRGWRAGLGAAISGVVDNPREFLLKAVLEFVRSVRECPGVLRIALVGSLTTTKPSPKDADMLVSIEDGLDLELLAKAGRHLKGSAQTINLGGDIFLADTGGAYIGRICSYRECRPRVGCEARHCGRRQHLNDDLHCFTLAADLIASPPLVLWPEIGRNARLPDDIERLLIAALEKAR
jgi:hypothetical protein